MLFKAYSILIRFRYLWLALSVLSALCGVYFYGYYKGKGDAENAAAVLALEKQNEGLMARKEIENEVNNIDRITTINLLSRRGELRRQDDYQWMCGV